jgi:hypothetical protein
MGIGQPTRATRWLALTVDGLSLSPKFLIPFAMLPSLLWVGAVVLAKGLFFSVQSVKHRLKQSANIDYHEVKNLVPYIPSRQAMDGF